jgi:hypothetical protein
MRPMAAVLQEILRLAHTLEARRRFTLRALGHELQQVGHRLHPTTLRCNNASLGKTTPSELPILRNLSSTVMGTA